MPSCVIGYHAMIDSVLEIIGYKQNRLECAELKAGGQGVGVIRFSDLTDMRSYDF